jgi:hypothetical protein
MKYNLKRHKTLEILSNNRILFNSPNPGKNFKLGVSFDIIEDKLNCDKNTCELIYSELYNCGEIKAVNHSFVGLYLTQEGLTSFSSKKYIKKNNDIILMYLKGISVIILFCISVYGFYYKFIRPEI